MRISKIINWTLAAILLLLAVKLVTAIAGAFLGAHQVPRHMGFGFGGHGMWGHHMGGFHFIWLFISAAFWIAVIAAAFGWVTKKMSKRRINQSIAAGPLTYPTNPIYPSYGQQGDFLDEWEKNLTKQNRESE